MNNLRILMTVLMCIIISTLSSARDNCRRIHLTTPVNISNSAVSRQITGHDISSFEVEVRAALSSCKERRGMSKNHWGISLIAPNDTLDVTLRFGNTDFGDFLDRRIAILTIKRNNVTLYTGESDEFRCSGKVYNSLALGLHNNIIDIKGGGDRIKRIHTLKDVTNFEPQEVRVWSVGNLYVTMFSTETCTPPQKAFASDYTPEDIINRFKTTDDPIEGYWTYFDRANDPTYAKPGGRYTLAIVKQDNKPVYDIIYVDGAVTYADKWHPMMLKGALRPTIFDGHYNLEWIDSTFERITEDIHATIENGSLLTLSFPLLKSTLRFSKVPLK